MSHTEGKHKWGERSIILLRKARDRGMHVSSDGELILQTGGKSRGSVCKEGYRVVQFSIDGERTIISIARAVCFLVHGEPPTFNHVADHIDRNKLNDHPTNLRWASRSENVRNSVKHKHPSQKLGYDKQRIDACIKAFDGVPLPHIESLAAEGNLMSIVAHRETLRQERDELVKALRQAKDLTEGAVPVGYIHQFKNNIAAILAKHQKVNHENE